MVIEVAGPDGRMRQVLVELSMLYFLDSVDNTGNPMNATRSPQTLIRNSNVVNIGTLTAPSGTTLRPGDVAIFLVTVIDEQGDSSTLTNEDGLTEQLFREYNPDRPLVSRSSRLLGVLKGPSS